MNAYDIYEAAFDSANDSAVATVEYVKAYADGALDMTISDEVAAKIVECHEAVVLANEANGELTNNHYHLVQIPLESIEV